MRGIYFAPRLATCAISIRPLQKGNPFLPGCSYTGGYKNLPAVAQGKMLKTRNCIALLSLGINNTTERAGTFKSSTTLFAAK